MELSGGQHICGLAKRHRQRIVQLQHPERARLTVTLPPATAIKCRLDDGLCDRQRQDDDGPGQWRIGGHILYPAGATGTAGNSVTLAPINYEFMALQFDGSNFRIVSITPRSASALGMFGHQITTGATPAIGFGSQRLRTSPSIGGNDSAGRVTVGAAAMVADARSHSHRHGRILRFARLSTKPRNPRTTDSRFDEHVSLTGSLRLPATFLSTIASAINDQAILAIEAMV